MTIQPYLDADQLMVIDIYNRSKLDELKFEKALFRLLPLEQDEKRRQALFESNIFVYWDVTSKIPEICGYIAICCEEIRGLNVLSQYRGQGIAQQLLLYALEKMNGSATLQVVNSNSPAKRLYQGFGFKKIESFNVNYNGVDVLVDTMTTGPFE